VWEFSHLVGAQVPTQRDKVSATVNAKSAYIYYISPTQVYILTPPNGLGVPKDDAQAAIWYRKAANAGDAGAVEALKRQGK
jgi:uncharacterized protein (TIGR03437 family)